MGRQENTFWIYCTCFVAPFCLVISNNIVTMLGGGGICSFVDPHCVGGRGWGERRQFVFKGLQLSAQV